MQAQHCELFAQDRAHLDDILAIVSDDLAMLWEGAIPTSTAYRATCMRTVDVYQRDDATASYARIRCAAAIAAAAVRRPNPDEESRIRTLQQRLSPGSLMQAGRGAVSVP